jgi:hypothetical protein
MTRVVKTIKGRKYAYEVTWDPEKKKQTWKYQGRTEKRIDSEKLKGELYCAIMRRARNKKDERKKIMNTIHEVLAKYG